MQRTRREVVAFSLRREARGKGWGAKLLGEALNDKAGLSAPMIACSDAIALRDGLIADFSERLLPLDVEVALAIARQGSMSSRSHARVFTVWRCSFLRIPASSLLPGGCPV